MSSEFDFLKDLGLTGEDLKGKSKLEVIDLISKKVTEKRGVFEGEAEKELIDNANSELPKVQKFFEKPFQIYVKKIGQKTKPTIVKVVGYIVEKSTVIAFHNDKLYQIEEADLIKSADILTEVKMSKSKEPKSKGRTKKN